MTARLKRTCMRSFKVAMFKLKFRHLAAQGHDKGDEAGVLVGGNGVSQANEGDNGIGTLHTSYDSGEHSEREAAIAEEACGDTLPDKVRRQTSEQSNLGSRECQDGDDIFKTNTLIEIYHSSDQRHADVQDTETSLQQADVGGTDEMHQGIAKISLCAGQDMIGDAFLDQGELEDSYRKKVKIVDSASTNNEEPAIDIHRVDGCSGYNQERGNPACSGNVAGRSSKPIGCTFETCKENETNKIARSATGCAGVAVAADSKILIGTLSNAVEHVGDEVGSKNEASQTLSDFVGKALQRLSLLGLAVGHLSEKMEGLGHALTSSCTRHASLLDEAKRTAEGQVSEIVLQHSRELDEVQCTAKETCCSILDQFCSLVCSAIASLPLSGISRSLSSLSASLDMYINQTHHEIDQRSSAIQSKEEEINAVANELEILRAKSNMLEESGDYLHRQNGRLKESNGLYFAVVSVVSAACGKLKKSVEDLSALQGELHGAFTSLHLMLAEQSSFLRDELGRVNEKLGFLRMSLSKLNIPEIKDHTLHCVGDAQKRYGSEIAHLKTANQELADQISALRSSISELQEKNEALLLVNNEIKEEAELKDSYSRELERSTDELMKSNKFYEDQLIASDNIIKSLRESRTRTGAEFSAEIEKVRKMYLKENGLLKLRIEELENELLQKSKDGCEVLQAAKDG